MATYFRDSIDPHTANRLLYDFFNEDVFAVRLEWIAAVEFALDVERGIG